MTVFKPNAKWYQFSTSHSSSITVSKGRGRRSSNNQWVALSACGSRGGCTWSASNINFCKKKMVFVVVMLVIGVLVVVVVVVGVVAMGVTVEVLVLAMGVLVVVGVVAMTVVVEVGVGVGVIEIGALVEIVVSKAPE